MLFLTQLLDSIEHDDYEEGTGVYDVYTHNGIVMAMDDDEMNPEEEAFMNGYLRA